ncbi:MAG: class I SAM-dependent methyltransferase [Candidatus Thorarchaeota archaeon]
MNDYYSRKLASNNLKRCYDLAPTRVKQYLQAEIDYVLQHINSSDTVIELGCGYGRVMKQIQPYCAIRIGIDASLESLELARDFTGHKSNCILIQTRAECLPLRNDSVDKVVCIQNGISAFKVDPLTLVKESIRITRKGGLCLFSSYSDDFWEERLDWFVLQSEEGLIGEIDWSKTSNGDIVCKDGFKASTFRAEDFVRLTDQLQLNAITCEIDESSVFCEIRV